MGSQVVLDGVFQNLYAGMRLAPDPLFRSMSRKALHQVQPVRRGGREMHLIARVSRKPGFHLVSLVCRVVIHHQMDWHVLWNIGVHLFEEGQELGTPMAAFQAANHFSGDHIQRGKPRSGCPAISPEPQHRRAAQLHGSCADGAPHRLGAQCPCQPGWWS